MTQTGHQPYSLAPPTMADLRRVVARVCGPNAEPMWQELLAHAGVHGDELDDASFQRLLAAFHGSEPALRLAAQAVAIRRRTHEHMSTVTFEPVERTA